MPFQGEKLFIPIEPLMFIMANHILNHILGQWKNRVTQFRKALLLKMRHLGHVRQKLPACLPLH